MYIDENLRQEIIKAFAPVRNISTFYLFDAIPPKKLENATLSYANISGDETIVALNDSTVFGSAKDGFIYEFK